MRALVACLATLFALAAVESWTYFFSPGFDENLMVTDDTLGWRLRPGATGWTAEENTLWIRINSDGLRDREHPRAKPPGTFRVAVLGDSYMEATQVRLDEMFATQLEQRLRACSAPLIPEVLNFGVSGYGTAQELLTFESKAAAYQPDLVITAVYFGNDVQNNSPLLNDDSLPFFVFDGDRLVLDTSHIERAGSQPWRIRARQFFTEHSRTAMLLYQPWVAFRAWQRQPPPEEPPSPEPPWDDEREALLPPTSPELIEAWRITEGILVKLAASVRARRAEPWLVSLSTPAQVDPDSSHRLEVQRELGTTDLFYPDRRLAALGAAHGIPTVTLAPMLAEYASANRVFLHGGQNRRTPPGTGHWNPVAHRVAADLVGRRLCDDSAALSSARRERAGQ